MNGLAYVDNMKKLIETFLANYISRSNLHTKWELLKYDIHKYTIKYTTGLAIKWKQLQHFFETT